MRTELTTMGQNGQETYWIDHEGPIRILVDLKDGLVLWCDHGRTICYQPATHTHLIRDSEWEAHREADVEQGTA